MINIFRIVAFLEGISYILLLFIGVPLKYIAGNNILVKALGMPHGILFVFYLMFALAVHAEKKWATKDLMIILAASIFPFGTFYVDWKYLRSTN